MFEPARVWSQYVTIDPRMLANPGRMKTPPSREKMLRMRPGDARRINAIERRANHLVTPVRRGGGLRKFTGDRKEDWLNEGESKKSPPKDKWADIRKIFRIHGETLLASDEGGLLREIGESLVNDPTVPQISRVVCFGMGSFVDEEGNVDPAACKRYVGAADLAVVLMGEPAAGEDGKPRFEVYVSEPELSKYEIDFLISHGLQVLNPYLHEGYYLIDSNTLVFGAPGVDPSLRLEQMILEFSRPAVIMMAPFNYRWNHDLWKQLDQQRRDAWSLLWKEYDYDGMKDPNEGAVQTKGYEIFPPSIAHYSLDASNILKPRAVLKAEADGRHPIHRGNYSYDLLGPFWGMHTWVRKAEFAPGPIVHDEPAPILVNEKE